jgi:pantetheine-phosphate adenylyltransferase
VIEQGARIFGELEVAVGVNPEKEKSYSFTTEERTHMLEVITEPLPNVHIGHIGMEYTVDYAARNGFGHILRGLRDSSDFAGERRNANVGREITPSIETVALLCPPELEERSSSMVKGLIGYGRWEEVVAEFVPPIVFAALKRQYEERQAQRRAQEAEPQAGPEQQPLTEVLAGLVRRLFD